MHYKVREILALKERQPRIHSATIADLVGCSSSRVRQVLRENGYKVAPGPPPSSPRWPINSNATGLRIHPEMADLLKKEAQRRNIRWTVLVRKLLENIIRDDLYEAVLGDQ